MNAIAQGARWAGVVFLAAGLLLSAAVVRADIVTAKNGQQLEGRVTRETDKEISVDVDGLELTMLRSEIAKVEKKPLPRKTKPAEPIAKKADATVSPEIPAAEAVPAPAALPSAEPLVQPTEFPILVFDSRTWQMGYQGSTDQGPVAQFVLENETVQNWTELLTVQMFPGLQTKAMPVDFAYSTREELSQVCPAADWRILTATQAEAFYQWSIQDCKAQPDQMEIVRVIRGELGMHLIHYAVKKPKSADQERLKWVERLSRAKLVKK